MNPKYVFGICIIFSMFLLSGCEKLNDAVVRTTACFTNENGKGACGFVTEGGKVYLIDATAR